MYNLQTILTTLGESASQASQVAVKKGDLAQIEQTYYYQDVGKMSPLGQPLVSTRYFDKGAEWDRIRVIRFIQSEVASLPEYKDAMRFIEECTSLAKKNIASGLTRFVQRCIQDPSSLVSNSQLATLVGFFVEDLTKAGIPWSTEVWLQGIRLPIKEVKLAENSSLRKPMPSDFKFVTSLEDIMMARPFVNPIVDPAFLPDVVLHLAPVTVTGSEARKEVDPIVQLLRMYRSAPVSYVRIRQSANTFVRGSGHDSFRPQEFNSTPRVLTKIECLALPEFIGQFEKLIRPKLKPPNYYNDAIDRYNDSLLSRQTIEARFAFAVMSLEALLLGKGNDGELGLRLRLCGAKLLSLVGLNPVTAYKDIAKAYGIRSDFVHGSHLKSKDSETDKHLNRVVNYTRIILLISAQIEPGNKNNENFLSLLIASLINPEAEHNLVKFLTQDHLDLVRKLGTAQ
ncbi:MAG: HEPN domain-containing protein [Chloroflexi bacterium]|nr:HEPN domain-containing protein [Chloroflexota bacterium]